MRVAQALVWLPASLGDAMAECLQQQLSELAAAWQLPAAGDVQAMLLPASGETDEAAAARDSIDLSQWEAAPLREWLAEQLMGARWPDSVIVDQAMRQLLQSLGQRLQASFGMASGDDAVPARRALPGHRGVLLQFTWAGRAMHLCLSLTQLEASGWLKTTARAPLAAVDLASALAQTPVPLRATLGKIDLQLSDWLHLSAGDVLLLDKPLDEPLLVQVPGSDWQRPAQLGGNAQGTHRALRWVAH